MFGECTKKNNGQKEKEAKEKDDRAKAEWKLVKDTKESEHWQRHFDFHCLDL